MKAEVASQFPFPWMALLAFAIFMLLFVGALFWVYRPGSKGIYQHMQNLPLKEEQE